MMTFRNSKKEFLFFLVFNYVYNGMYTCYNFITGDIYEEGNVYIKYGWTPY